MLIRLILFGALLGGAPLFSQHHVSAEPKVVKQEFVWFQLSETKQDVAKLLGLPHLSADFGTDYHSWQYRDDATDDDDFSHSLTFRRSTGHLVAVTRSYADERNVDVFFPAGETTPYCRSAETGPEYCVRVRRLSGDRLLIAAGVSKPGQLTSSLTLILEPELDSFLPWLASRVSRPSSRSSGHP